MLKFLKNFYSFFNSFVNISINFEDEDGIDKSFNFKGKGFKFFSSNIEEEWKFIRIDGVDSDYQISNLKRVRSLKKGKIRILNPYEKQGSYHLYFKGKRIKFFIKKQFKFYY